MPHVEKLVSANLGRHYLPMKQLISFTLAIVLSGCGQPNSNGRSVPDQGDPSAFPAEQEASREQPSPIQSAILTAGPLTAPSETDYVGRWKDPSGGSLVVTDPPQGGLILEFHIGGEEKRYEGSVTAEGLRFMRGDTAESAILLPDKDGREGGCISISDAETYCRS